LFGDLGLLELFGKDRISKMILIDQMPMISVNPIWSEQEKIDAGGILDKNALWDVPMRLPVPKV